MPIVQDPRQFIEAYLILPSGSDEPSPPPSADSRVGGTPGYPFRGAGKGAKGETIQFLKHLILPRRQVYALTFEDEAGQEWDYFCSIEQDEQGYWHVMASASSIKDTMRRASHSFPWVHLVGGSEKNYLWAAGYVTDKALNAGRIRLITRNGVVLEDIVQDGLVLLQTDQPVEIPAQVEIYTHTGELIGTQSLFDYALYKAI